MADLCWEIDHLTEWSQQDNNNTAVKNVTVKLASGSFDSSVRCHITDQFSMYTEYPVALQPDGTLLLELQPDSFVFIEF